MIVYGRNVAKEVLSNNLKINKVLLQERYSDQELIDELNKRNVNIKYLNKNMMNKLEEGNHQGIILDIEDFKYKELQSVFNLETALLVILDHLEDPHNLGAIIRTCEAAKVDAIIIPIDRSVNVNSTVVHTSAGTTRNVNIIQVTNIANTIRELKKYNYWVVGTDMNGVDYHDVDYKGKTAIVIGNEGSGISDVVIKNCDFIASIPMYGTVNSLNASVAAGIVIFEAVNQRK